MLCPVMGAPMIKALHLLNHVSRKTGGLYTSVRSLSKALHSGGVDVSVMGLEDGMTAEDIPTWQPVTARAVKIIGPRRFYYSPRLLPAIMQSAPDLLHSHGIWHYPSLAANRFFERNRTSYLISTHGMLDPWALKNSQLKKTIAGWLFENAHLQNAACLSALCESEAGSIRAYGLKNPICIVPNGTDLPEIGNQESGAGNHPSWAGILDPGRKVLLFLGRFHPKKGLVNLVRAWSKVQRAKSKKVDEWVLGIAGFDEFGQEGKLKRLANELGIQWTDARNQKPAFSQSSTPRLRSAGPDPRQSASLLFLGPQIGEAKSACYTNCDAFILPSFSEGLPMTVLEAWAYEKPVLMTSECNLPEGFAAEAAIRIAPSSESIEEGLRELFAAPDASRFALGAHGRDLVVSRFTWPEIARQMKTVYEWVLGGGQKPDCVRLN